MVEEKEEGKEGGRRKRQKDGMGRRHKRKNRLRLKRFRQAMGERRYICSRGGIKRGGESDTGADSDDHTGADSNADLNAKLESFRMDQFTKFLSSDSSTPNLL